MTENELIKSIKGLKEIKPSQEWASLLKSQILTSGQKAVKIPAQKVSILDVISNFKFQISNSFGRRLAYSFAAMVFIFVGLIGFAQYTMPGDLFFPIKKIAEQSQSVLTGESPLKQSAASLNNRINDLSQAAKGSRKTSISSAINEVKSNALALTKNLKSEQADSATIKEIADSLKTLADVPGTNLAANKDIKDLYRAVVESQIIDLEKSTLTDGQKEALARAEQLYEQEDYVAALEEILLIDK